MRSQLYGFCITYQHHDVSNVGYKSVSKHRQWPVEWCTAVWVVVTIMDSMSWVKGLLLLLVIQASFHLTRNDTFRVSWCRYIWQNDDMQTLYYCTDCTRIIWRYHLFVSLCRKFRLWRDYCTRYTSSKLHYKKITLCVGPYGYPTVWASLTLLLMHSCGHLLLLQRLLYIDSCKILEHVKN